MKHRLRRLLAAAYRRLPPPVLRAVVAARGFPEPLVVDRPAGSKVAVLAPHPDDELIGCGGSVAKHLDAGDDVTVVLVTSGEATPGLDHLAPAERAPHREGEARRAMEAFGLAADHLRFLRAPDSGTAEDAQLDARVGGALDEIGPDLVYAPWPIDANRDHRATATALGAWLARPGAPRPLVALYEVWTPLTPTHLVAIDGTIDRKLKALEHYECALATVDYLHTARGLAAYRSAAYGGKGYAEAFCILDPAAFASLLARLVPE